MIFWAAAECHNSVYAKLRIIRQVVEPYLNSAFSQGVLNRLNVTLRYIPIVMPPHMLDAYPERNVARISELIYDCAPQLDFAPFVSGTVREQLDEYFQGISKAGPHLRGFHADTQQLAEFDRIIAQGPFMLDR